MSRWLKPLLPMVVAAFLSVVMASPAYGWVKPLTEEQVAQMSLEEIESHQTRVIEDTKRIIAIYETPTQLVREGLLPDEQARDLTWHKARLDWTWAERKEIRQEIQEQKRAAEVAAPVVATAAIGSDIVAVGLLIQNLGFDVSEHPAFGGVCGGCHSPTGKHYVAKAIDVNWYGGGSEYERINWLVSTHLRPLIEARLISILWQSSGHYDHLHVEVP